MLPGSMRSARNLAVPRRRRRVPGVVLFSLRPLFRYSYHRDAWILRAVGERYGPVLRPRIGHAETNGTQRHAAERVSRVRSAFKAVRVRSASKPARPRSEVKALQIDRKSVV